MHLKAAGIESIAEMLNRKMMVIWIRQDNSSDGKVEKISICYREDLTAPSQTGQRGVRGR